MFDGPGSPSRRRSRAHPGANYHRLGVTPRRVDPAAEPAHARRDGLSHAAGVRRVVVSEQHRPLRGVAARRARRGRRRWRRRRHRVLHRLHRRWVRLDRARGDSTGSSAARASPRRSPNTSARCSPATDAPRCSTPPPRARPVYERMGFADHGLTTVMGLEGESAVTGRAKGCETMDVTDLDEVAPSMPCGSVAEASCCWRS